ncbi:hypothetical protein [Hyalangium versicolor]|uniref:hypothetical protein n=1 Tax=Hyalangium versicolor TaxID=2861190 RepID=UPI001CCA3651|nr:hypothetical protein [Hyalangium versicolor]
MRYLLISAVVAWWGLGCATAPVVAPLPIQPQVQEAEVWQRRYEEERARSDELGCRLAAAEAALELHQLERAEAEQAEQALSEELARAESERRALEELNQQLHVQQRELAEMHEQMSDVWFESALSRARRHSPPPEPPAPSSGSGQGASP